MVIGFIAVAALAIGVIYMTLRSTTTTQTMIVDVVGAIDGRTVEVVANKRKERVVLAGIGFPPGDSRAESECADAVQDVVSGRRLYMEVFKDVGGCKYVSLSSSNGDCLNEMMLEKGLARYESTGVGFVGRLVEAETRARNAEVGVWDRNRLLFRHLSNQSSEAARDEVAFGRD